jgi:hypothetical protein
MPIDLNGDGSVRAFADYNGNHELNSGGSISLYKWDGDRWNLLGNDGNSNSISLPESEAQLSRSLALNSAGTIIAVGTNAAFFDVESFSSVTVYWFNGSEWVLRGQPIFSEQRSALTTGVNVGISADGNRIVFAEPFHDQGIDSGTLAGPNLGIIRVFEWSGSDWNQLGSTLLGPQERSSLGYQLSFSADGNTIAASEGFNRDIQTVVFRWDGQNWIQLGPPINRTEANFFQSFENGDLDISGDGNTLVIGDPNNSDESATNGGMATSIRGMALIGSLTMN